MKFPLRIIPFRSSIRDEISAYIIEDAAGRGISVHCEVDPLIRDVGKLWSPQEAEALAKRIARWLTDEHETEVAIRKRQAEMQDPHSPFFGR